MIDRLRSHLPRADVGVLVAATAFVTCAYVLVRVIDEVVEGQTDWVDHRVMEWVGRHRGPLWFGEVMRDCTALGGWLVLSLTTLAVGGFLFFRRERNALAFLLAAVVGAFASNLALKGFFHRDRPTVFEHGSYTVTSSFPSGHSMLSAAVWLTLGVMLSRLERSRYLKAYFIAIAIGISGLVGVSRVYLGVHWPSDVLAGWMAGTVWALGCFFVMRHFQHRGAIEPPVTQVERAPV